MRSLRLASAVLGSIFVFSSPSARLHAQTTGFPPASQSGSPVQRPGSTAIQSPVDSEPDPLKAQAEAQRQRAVANDRQKRIEADTERLFHLAEELKADVAKSNKNELSLDVVRKAEEIEKLAHDVKQRMKG